MFYENVFFMLIFFVLSVVFHEAGHFLVAKRIGYKPFTKFDGFFPMVSINTFVTPNDDIMIIKGGLIFGLIPIFVGCLVIPLFIIPVIVAYIFGVRSDIKRLNRIRKKLRGKRK